MSVSDLLGMKVKIGDLDFLKARIEDAQKEIRKIENDINRLTNSKIMVMRHAASTLNMDDTNNDINIEVNLLKKKIIAIKLKLVEDLTRKIADMNSKLQE